MELSTSLRLRAFTGDLMIIMMRQVISTCQFHLIVRKWTYEYTYLLSADLHLPIFYSTSLVCWLVMVAPGVKVLAVISRVLLAILSMRTYV